MALNVTFSATSVDDSRLDEDSADSNGSPFTSDDEDEHIGYSSRPRLPLVLSSSSISKSLPSRLAGGIVSRGPGPYRHQSVQPQPTHHYYQRHPPRLPPPPPPPLHPPPPLIRPISSTSPHSLDSHNRWHSSSAGPQYSGDDTSYDKGHESYSNSSQEGDGPKVELRGEANSVGRLTEHYVEVQTRRSRLSANFKRAEAQRARVSKLRQNKDEATGEFMAAAKALFPDSVQLHQLRQLFTAMCNTHSEYQEAQQCLEESMDEYHHGQKDLESREGVFYKTAMEALGVTLFDIDNDRDSHSNKSEDSALRGITGDRPETFHPLYDKLRKAFGELQLARELLVNTQMKRKALHARKTQPVEDDSLALIETYGDAGRKKAHELRATALMTEDDIEQLQRYDELEQDAKQDIEIYTEKVKILKHECTETGVLPLSSNFQQEGFEADLFYQDEIRLVPSEFNSNDDSATLAHPVFPALLSNPTHLLHDFPQTAMQSLQMALKLPHHAPVRAKQIKEAAREVNMQSVLSDIESEDKSEYINRWLLHKLHHSAMEAEQLWTTSRSRLKILDIDRWQQHVLYFWLRDKPVEMDINAGSVGFGDNDTNKVSKLGGSFVESKTPSHSVAGSSNGLGN
ncbi:hypothetical protein GGS24DRAFT_215597 [Hypoxylon argillaceum]|nr:hypothetical protein GGS24DRAFT_215597 [Hypoxylon argillaceum]